MQPEKRDWTVAVAHDHGISRSAQPRGQRTNRKEGRVFYRNGRFEAGRSFDSPAEGRPESTRRPYDLLEIRRDLTGTRF